MEDGKETWQGGQWYKRVCMNKEQRVGFEMHTTTRDSRLTNLFRLLTILDINGMSEGEPGRGAIGISAAKCQIEI